MFRRVVDVVDLQTKDERDGNQNKTQEEGHSSDEHDGRLTVAAREK